MSATGRPQRRVGIIGCGLIGRKRAEALGGDLLVACYDLNGAASAALAADFGAKACANLDELLGLELDVIVVAAIHSELPALAVAALRSGAHVLVEKPAGISVAGIDEIAAAAAAAERRVKVGFNHRFHPGIRRAIETARSGRYGKVLYLRGRYGHGGRLGYEKEWRADPSLSGGGEIVDQGMHLLDLSYWLHGALPLHSSMLRSQFWDAPVDDNAILVLGEKGGVGSDAPFSLLHVSWTEWKNTFSLEIACERAKLAVDGLVRSYGPQTLRIFEMRPELGPPDVEEVRYPDRDNSWEREWEHFMAGIDEGTELLGDLSSARYAWSCVEAAQERGR
jgi:predicted dehydrogenase